MHPEAVLILAFLAAVSLCLVLTPVTWLLLHLMGYRWGR